MTNHRLKPTGFIPAIELCRAFYHEAVKPLLQQEFPNLAYAAALLGSGSEILGFDDGVSTDHHWGPRLQIFLNEPDIDEAARPLDDLLRHELPYTFRGYSVNFSEPDPQDRGTQSLEIIDSGEINHRVEIWETRRFIYDYLGLVPAQEIEPADWLAIPRQRLAAITAGAVYHDEVGLETLRSQFAWYPRDIWLYVMAGSWDRIGEDEHLMGRAGLVGDEVGSALIAGRIVNELMHLTFLQERRYAPYPKWFGTAFKELEGSSAIRASIRQVLSATDWNTREEGLVQLYEYAARRHNSLGIGASIDEKVHRFFGRPFRVIGGCEIAQTLLEEVEDPEVRGLCRRRIIGSIDTWTDNTSFKEDRSRWEDVRALYRTRVS